MKTNIPITEKPAIAISGGYAAVVDSSDSEYNKGHNAYHDGYRLKDNPHKRFSENWEQWRQGWNDEKSDDPYWEEVRRIHSNVRRRRNNGA